MIRERYPLGLCIAAIVATWLGLSAAALGVKWGAASGAGDALSSAWLYVQVMAALSWLLIWPAAALRPSSRPLLSATELLWQFAALWMGMVPALATAACLSAIPATPLLTAMGYQFAMGVFAMGALALCGRVDSPAVSALVAALPAGLALMGSVGVFVCSEFFPHIGRGWQVLLPLPLMARAACPPDGWSPGGGFWLAASAYAFAGMAVLAACRRRARDKVA
jgi:hypothetical protein